MKDETKQKIISEWQREVAIKGGQATARKGRAYYVKIGKIGANKRWQSHKKVVK